MACLEGFEPPTYCLEGNCFYPAELQADVWCADWDSNPGSTAYEAAALGH